jgi:seryl-tRNA synthetase
METWRDLMLRVPNVPDPSVADGNSDAENVEVKVWGEKTKFDFIPKDHVEIMKNLDLVDFERGSKVHGFRGYFLKGDAAILSMAIWRYAMDFFGAKGFTPMLAPAIVRKEHFYGTGHLPNDAEDLFETQDDDYPSGIPHSEMIPD